MDIGLGFQCQTLRCGRDMEPKTPLIHSCPELKHTWLLKQWLESEAGEWAPCHPGLRPTTPGTPWSSLDPAWGGGWRTLTSISTSRGSPGVWRGSEIVFPRRMWATLSIVNASFWDGHLLSADGWSETPRTAFLFMWTVTLNIYKAFHIQYLWQDWALHYKRYLRELVTQAPHFRVLYL